MKYTEWADSLNRTESFGHRFIVSFLTRKPSFIKKHGQKKYDNMARLLN